MSISDLVLYYYKLQSRPRIYRAGSCYRRRNFRSTFLLAFNSDPTEADIVIAAQRMALSRDVKADLQNFRNQVEEYWF